MSEIGHPTSRADGAAKVSGAARYTADIRIDGLAHAVLAGSPVAVGRITAIDTSAAERSPGVAAVFTFRNFPKLNAIPSPPAGQSVMPLQDDRIHYEGQPIALVVAETLEEAQRGAALIVADIKAERPEVDFMSALDRATKGTSFAEPDTDVGDVTQPLTAAAQTIDGRYTTADRHHLAMEPSVTIADWRDGTLVLHDATQWVYGVRMIVGAALGVATDQIRVESQYLGGGFGSKGYIWTHQILTAAAARALGRPIKLVLTRAQTFTSHGYQPASLQRVTLAADHFGRLTAIRHHSTTPTSRADGYVEYAAISSRASYACPNIQTRHRIVAVDRSTPTPMRAPHEGLSAVGLECAMDELAERLAMDPLELRVRNYAERDATSGKPFSSKKLRDCYQIGAAQFGWHTRSRAPRSMRDGRQLVGWGVATAMMQTFRFPSKARVTLNADGTVLIEAGAQEIGTGVRTILPQIAADALGLPLDRMRLSIGDTALPEAGGTFGSSTTMGVGSAVHAAATRLKEKIQALADQAGAIGPDDYVAILSRQSVERISTESDWSSPSVVQRIGLVSEAKRLAADGAWSPGPDASPLGEPPGYSMHGWGAVFTEVRVDEDFLIPRVTRLVGVYSAGRIINPKTAHSQMTGGMIWGIGQALLEESSMDRALGRYVSKNLAGHLIPVNADVPELHVQFVDEYDPLAGPLGARGIGELGAVGVAPAILNAIWHATGVRLRDVPVRPEHLMSGNPAHP
jgi:xanthine dehydrogenase YagR molybdenum-binding subunit